MLEVEGLHAYYGKSHILQGVDFAVRAGEIVALLGRNGAGRTTTIKTLMGEVRPHGEIRFKGARIDGMKPHEIARRGLGYVPENRDIFPALTVRENMLLGMKSWRAARRWSIEQLFALFPMLAARAPALRPPPRRSVGRARGNRRLGGRVDEHRPGEGTRGGAGDQRQPSAWQA